MSERGPGSPRPVELGVIVIQLCHCILRELSTWARTNQGRRGLMISTPKAFRNIARGCRVSLAATLGQSPK